MRSDSKQIATSELRFAGPRRGRVTTVSSSRGRSQSRGGSGSVAAASKVGSEIGWVISSR